MRVHRTARLCHSATLVAMAACAIPGVAFSQSREPLCVTVASRRLVGGPATSRIGDDRMVAVPFAVPAGTAPAGAPAFLALVADPSHMLHVADARETTAATPAAGRAAGFAMVRLDATLATIGVPSWIALPALNPAAPETSASTPTSTSTSTPTPTPTSTSTPASAFASPSTAFVPMGATVSRGIIVLFRRDGDLWSLFVPPVGEPVVPRRIASAPQPVDAGAPRGFSWHSIAARGTGAIALAGTSDGQVIAMRFDGQGSLQGTPVAWTRRVGGEMQLLPADGAPTAALLARPVPGTGPRNEPARAQVLVHLDDNLQPVHTPAATGFAQFPMAYLVRRSELLLFQWADQQGVAIATLPMQRDRIGESLPRLWYAQPPLEGAHVGHGAVVDRDGVALDFALYEEPRGALHGHLAWVPPGGAPTFRRDVIASRGHAIAPPVVVGARDGFVAFMALEDETGAAIDAHHVRCELVTLPAR